MKNTNYLAAAECLKVLAHPHRLKIVALLKEELLTVGEIAERLDTLNHMTSEHLRLMQRCGFLKSNRAGRKIYYQIAEPCLLEILKCVEKKFSKGTK